MDLKFKRGRVGVTQIIFILLIAFLAIVGIVFLVDVTQGGNSWGDALTNSFESVSKGFMNVLGPTLNWLLNLGKDSNTNFLIVLAFILISIIVVGTLDSVNIFGEDKQGGLVNLAIGLIVSIIGVRFMPNDIWASLTAPSSAFVATILIGAPFAALFFVTMKLRFNVAAKALWLFYVIFMSYLIFFPAVSTSATNEFKWIYVIFLILAGIMLFFDSTVRGYIHREKVALNLAKGLSVEAIKRRLDIEKEIKEWQSKLKDIRDKGERATAKSEIDRLKKEYKELARAEE